MTPGQNTHRLLDPCFNPCFSGSYIMTGFLPLLYELDDEFQSLFQWILYYDFFCHPTICATVVFQSLFQWILYYDNSCCHPELAFPFCFNPCFSGSYIMTYEIATKCKCQIRFNPCFSGSYIMTITACSILDIQSGFNPCFSGSYIMTILFLLSHQVSCFVSILVLVDLIL